MKHLRYILCFCLILSASMAVSASESIPEHTQQTNSTLETVFDDVLDWGVADGIITTEQHAALSQELSRRLSLIREQPGSSLCASRSLPDKLKHSFLNVSLFFLDPIPAS